jgi:hypothetical protein
MLPKLPPANDSDNSKASEEKRNEIFKKIAVALETSTVKPISDKIVTKIITDFTSSLQETNKDLLETLLDEDKKLLKETVDAISKLQGKNSKELDRLLLLAEKLILSGQTNKNDKMQGIGERLKESVLKGKPETDSSGRTLLSGDQDTMKNRFIRSMTGITPEQAKVQGTSVLGYLGKTSSRAFREGMGSLFVSDKERSGDVARKSEQENKQISLAQQTASELYKILDSSGQPKQNTNSPDNSAYDSNGNEITTNLSNPASSIDTTTRSDVQELAAGIRDTDSSFSRSSTVTNDPWEQRWKDLLDLMNKIKDCVCSCQCTDQMGQGPEIDIDVPTRRNTRRAAGRAVGRGILGRGITAVGAGILGLGTGVAGLATGLASGVAGFGSSAYDYVKEKVGFGSKKPSTAIPESMPTRTNPTAPATEVTSPRTANNRGVRIPTPGNARGIPLPTPANDTSSLSRERIPRYADGTPLYTPDGPETPGKKEGKIIPIDRSRTTPATSADVIQSKKPGGFFSGLTDRAKNLIGKIEIPESVRNAGSKVSKFFTSPTAKVAGKVAGRAAAPIGVGLDVYGRKKQGQSNSKVAVGVGSGLAGAALGAKAGAVAGGAIGSLFFGAGAVPGAAIGGFVGGVGGYFAGSGLGDFVYDKITGKKKPASEAKPGDKKPGTVAPVTTPRQNLMARDGVVSPATVKVMPPSTKTTAGLESGRNLDATYIEKGTVATKDKLQINVPPPTVIQAPSKNAEGGQQIVSGGNRDRMNARPADSSWLRFQEKRAVA